MKLLNIPLGVYQIINFVNAILSLIIGSFVLLTRKISKQILLFSVFAFLVFLWDIFYFLAFQTSDYVLSRFLFRTCMIAGTLILPVFTEFTFALVSKEVNPLFRRINFGIAAIIILTIYTDLYALDGGPFLVFHYWPIIGFMSTIQIIHYGINVFVSHKELFEAAITGPSFLKKQAKIIIFGTSLGYLGAASNFLLWFRIPFPPILNVLIPVYVISVAYAITKHRLMNISVVISRTLAWFLTIIFYGGIYTALMMAHRMYISTNIGLLYWGWTIIYGVIVGHNFQRTRLFLQTTTDRAFIKGWYDYRHVIRKIAAELGRALTRQDIVKILYPILQDEIDIAEVDFYFLDEKNDLYSVLNPMTGEPSSLFLDKDNPLVKQAIQQKDIAACDGKLCVPSFSGDTLLSLFVLGKKRSGDEYTDDDIELFKTISEYVSIALEYIVKPYEEVRDKFEATERKLLETERQLERSERLASLGTLTAGIAHEIRNPLGIIHSTAEELTDKLRNMEELEDYKKSILRNTKRITTIITNMLNMAKTNEKKFTKLDINKIVEDSLKLVTINGIKIVKELQPVSKIVGDEDEIKQIMINLCANAVEAMPQGGELRIKTYQIEKEVYIEVSDTGIGIPKETQAKIFDPFFSTRHEGSGLGLSIVYRIVKEHGGDVKVKSDVGRGATFTVKFTGVE